MEPNSSLTPTGEKDCMGRAGGRNSRGAQSWRIIEISRARVPGALDQGSWHAPLWHGKTGLQEMSNEPLRHAKTSFQIRWHAPLGQVTMGLLGRKHVSLCQAKTGEVLKILMIIPVAILLWTYQWLQVWFPITCSNILRENEPDI